MILTAFFGVLSRFQQSNCSKYFTDYETITLVESFIDSDELQDFQDNPILISASYDISLKHVKIANFDSQIQSYISKISSNCLSRYPPSI